MPKDIEYHVDFIEFLCIWELDVTHFRDETKRSVRYFIRVLGPDAVEQAMRTAIAKLGGLTSPRDVFRYFCGICWTQIRGEQDGTM